MKNLRRKSGQRDFSSLTIPEIMFSFMDPGILNWKQREKSEHWTGLLLSETDIQNKSGLIKDNLLIESSNCQLL